MTGAGRDRADDPVVLRDVLDAVAADLEGPASETIGTIVRSWPELVGADLVGVARPGSLIDGVLTVVVDEPAAATALRQRAGQLRARLDARCGPAVVRAIKVRVKAR